MKTYLGEHPAHVHLAGLCHQNPCCNERTCGLLPYEFLLCVSAMQSLKFHFQYLIYRIQYLRLAFSGETSTVTKVLDDS